MLDWFRHSAREKPAKPPLPGRPFSAATRQENLDRLAEDAFDLLIIGGGITGAAIARDAAMRGMRTALVEKDDFASGTSGRSSRLIHGGIRYLEYYQFKLVFEACCERRIMRRVAPRLVRPLPFLYPLYRQQKPAPWKLHLGLTLYDALGLFRNVQRHRWLNPSEVQEREPAIACRGLLGAARFYDAQADDARLTLLTAKSAHLHGAVTANHVRVADLMVGGERVFGACLVDRVQQSLGADGTAEAKRECRTQEKLEGAQTRRALDCALEGAVGEHLLKTYGSDGAWVLAYAEENPALAERIDPELPYLMAEVPYGVHHEMAVSLTDVMMRRTHLIYETPSGGLERARAVVSLMATRLGWDEPEVDRQVSDYAAQVALTQGWREA